MLNVKIIIDCIAIPISLIATVLIIAKNKRNLMNVLIGLTTFLAGVLTITFGLLKEVFYAINQDLALIFTKLAFFSLVLVPIPIFNYTFYYWKAKYRRMPNWLFLTTIMPSLILAAWLVAFPNSIGLVETSHGINFNMADSLIVISSIITLVMFAFFTLTIVDMTKGAKYFPTLRKRMNIFISIYLIGFGGSLITTFIFQFVDQEILQPYALIMIITMVCLTILFSFSLTKQKRILWHGCPKLLVENGNLTYCANIEDGIPVDIKLIDIWNVVEKIQLDVEVLKSEEKNCANIVFVDENRIVRCLTNHKPILVLDDFVTQEEMELAREMEQMNGKELCSTCLHKIIAYRKEHKDKTTREIKTFFLGMSAEDFFGIN